MERFFDLTFRPFFVITGIGTALAGLYAFWPRWAAETAGKIPFARDYTIIIQHWGHHGGPDGRLHDRRRI